MGLLDGGGLADFGSGLVSGLVTGGRALAGAFSPDVRREQAQQRARAEEAAQAQKRIVASHILEAIHSGQIDDDHLPQMQQTLGKLGYDFPVESLGASPEAKARLETHIKNKQREAILRTPEAMAMIDSGDYLGVNKLLLKNNFGDPLEFAKTAAEINKKDTVLQGFESDKTIYQGGKLVREGTPKEQPDIASINAAIAIINDPNTPEDKRQQFRTYLDHKGQGMQIINYPSPIAVTKPDGTQGMVSFNNKGGFTETPFTPPAKEKVQKPLPSPAVNDLSAAGASLESTRRQASTFKDEYGNHTILGDKSNLIGRTFGDASGQAQWWQDADASANQARHTLFGGALTGYELPQWNKTAINPGMDSGEIRKNLTRRMEIEKRAAGKLARGYIVSGYSPEAISEFLGIDLSLLQTDQAGHTIDKQTEAGAAVPAALPATATVAPTLPPARSTGVPASTAGRLIDKQTATGAPPPVLSPDATMKSLENAKAAIAAGKDRPFIVNKLLRMGVPQSSIDRYLGK